MKVYIKRNDQSDFVCDAPTIGNAFITYWLKTHELPKTSYRIHHGRQEQSREVSAAVAYWLLEPDLREALSGLLRDESTDEQFHQFCQTVVQAAELLEP